MDSIEIVRVRGRFVVLVDADEWTTGVAVKVAAASARARQMNEAPAFDIEDGVLVPAE